MTIRALLTTAGYWDKLAVWRHLGDIENNYSTVGNQQAEPIALLAEKLVNGIDAASHQRLRSPGHRSLG